MECNTISSDNVSIFFFGNTLAKSIRIAVAVITDMLSLQTINKSTQNVPNWVTWSAYEMRSNVATYPMVE